VCDPVQSPLAGSYFHKGQSSYSLKGGDFIDKVSHCQLLKNFAACSHLLISKSDGVLHADLSSMLTSLILPQLDLVFCSFFAQPSYGPHNEFQFLYLKIFRYEKKKTGTRQLRNTVSPSRCVFAILLAFQSHT
jgi:hypothetical protein